MNTNYEPAFLVIDFCTEIKKQDGQGPFAFDFNKGSQDRKDFMEWLQKHSYGVEFLNRYYDGDEECFFSQAYCDPDFVNAWA